MKAARIVVLLIAVGAGGMAYALSRGKPATAPAPTAAAPSIETVGVLVAKRAIDVGHNLSADDLSWETWPTASASDGMIRQSNRPAAVDELKGAVARGTFVTGEPIREQKLIKIGGSGFLSAILPGGMRAASVEIEEENRAGGFVLPNDRVDVVLTRRDAEAQKNGNDGFVSETLLTNIRVLAIGQTIEDKEGQRSVAGKAVATLEVNPRQAEVLARASESGTIALVLRSLADSSPGQNDAPVERAAGAMSVIRYGIPSVSTTR